MNTIYEIYNCLLGKKSTNKSNIVYSTIENFKKQIVLPPSPQEPNLTSLRPDTPNYADEYNKLIEKYKADIKISKKLLEDYDKLILESNSIITEFCRNQSGFNTLPKIIQNAVFDYIFFKANDFYDLYDDLSIYVEIYNNNSNDRTN